MIRSFRIHSRNGLGLTGICRSYATAHEKALSKLPRVDDKLHGYTVSQVQPFPELDLVAVQLEHDKTGAGHLHISSDDTNNVFAIGFGTPPSSHNGVPHILEHTTLCGSEKYNVRDPFFKMYHLVCPISLTDLQRLKRSLISYMNAFTTADMKNLRDVYLDAALRPRLRKLDFLQEGWRLEQSDSSDPKSPVIFKGVVYNEMKGYMRKFFEGTIYGNDSGGDPKHITSLTHGELVDFHQKHYHPSNSRSITYGNMPLEEHLEDLNKRFSKYERQKLDQFPMIKSPWNETRRVETEGPVDPLSPPDQQSKLSLSFLLPTQSENAYEKFLLGVLSNLLLDGHSSPFYKSLLETGLGSDFSPNTGLDSTTQNVMFSIGLQGVKEQDLTTVEEEFINILERTAQEGFKRDRIDAILHQIEISQKHRTASFGMSVAQRLIGTWFHSSSPLQQLEFDHLIGRLLQDLQRDPQMMQNLIRSHFLDNRSRMIFLSRPSETFEAVLEKEETARLEQHVSRLSEADTKTIHETGLQLRENQNAKEDIDCLPSLTIADIPREEKSPTLETHCTNNNVPVQWLLKGNGVTYLRGMTSLRNLPERLKLYLPLFCEALRNLGTLNESMEDLEERIKRKTGDLQFSPSVITDPYDFRKHEVCISMSTFALDHNVDDAAELFRTLIHYTNFDNVEKLRTLIRISASGLSNSLAEGGHAFARSVATSKLSAASKDAELLRGLSQVHFIGQLAKQDDLSSVISNLKEIVNYAFCNDSTKFFVTTNSNNAQRAGKAVGSVAESLRSSTTSGIRSLADFKPTLPNKEYYKMPFGVSFVSTALNGVQYVHPDSASLLVLSHILEPHLHREIREKGGAYGSGLAYSGLSGIASFYSYRDPDERHTLNTMSEAARKGFDQLSSSSLQEAKLSIFQGVDVPLSLSSEGLAEFTSGVTREMKQERRTRLLDTTIEDVRRSAELYFDNAFDQGKYSTVILGPMKDNGLIRDNWATHESLDV